MKKIISVAITCLIVMQTAVFGAGDAEKGERALADVRNAEWTEKLFEPLGINNYIPAGDEAVSRVNFLATLMSILGGETAEAETGSGHPCTVEQARRYLSDMLVYLNVTSLNLMVGESHDTELAELLADDVSPDPVDTVSENETVQEVRLLLSQLPERESTVLRLRYGIPDDRCRTLDEIGAQLGVTRERIRQIQVRAERHLREMLKRRSSSTLFAA